MGESPLARVGGLIDVGAGLLVSSRGISWISPRFGDKHIGLRAKEGSRENASPSCGSFRWMVPHTVVSWLLPHSHSPTVASVRDG